MSDFYRRASLCFAAGCVGGLANAALVWYLGREGIPQMVGVSIAPAWTASFLYQRMVWGGIWGLVFLMPAMKGGFWVGVFSRGILFSFMPSFLQLFYVLPFMAGKGLLGLGLGKLTPVFVCLYNMIWGFSTALWLHITQGDS
ncbi:MAG: hypothetical protein MUC41_01120 [Syntrophobacteraceae bacterium]|jgi:hypothetical protein|nr:hypothetical protein [Syntrophobacteraceae bacterium]